MRCPNCGRENEPGVRTCLYCGSAFPVRRPNPNAQRPVPNGRKPVPSKKKPSKAILILRYLIQQYDKRKQNPNKKPLNKKLIAIVSAALVAVIIVCTAIGVSNNHKDEPLESRQLQMFYSKGTGGTNVVFAGKSFEEQMNGSVKMVYANADRTVQAALTDTGELYYMTAQALTRVSARVQSFVLSADGSALAYIMDNSPEPTDVSETEEATTTSRRSAADETTEPETEYVPAGGEKFMEYSETALFLYDSATGKSALVANNVSAESVSLSPSGTAVCYAVTEETGESFEGFVFQTEAYTSAGRNTLPIACSDDGVRLYFVKYEYVDDCWIMKLFAKNGENEIKLGECADMNRFVAYLNSDFTQIIFGISGKNGNFFYCNGEEEKVKLSAGYNPLYPYGLHEVQNGKVIVSPLATFAKSVFADAENMAQYLDGKMNCVSTQAQGVMFRLSPDSKTLYYVDSNDILSSVSVRKGTTKELASHVMNFDLSVEGKTVYYVTLDNELYCMSGSKATLAAENVYVKGSGLCVTEGGCLYFLKDYSYGNGTLCYIKGNSKAKVLDEVNNVHDLAADTGNSIYYRANYSSLSGAYDLYYGEGKKYTCILKELN